MIGHWHVAQSPLESKTNTKYRVTPENLFKEIVPKFEAGFNVSIADLLGRGFATEFVVCNRYFDRNCQKADVLRLGPMAA